MKKRIGLVVLLAALALGGFFFLRDRPQPQEIRVFFQSGDILVPLTLGPVASVNHYDVQGEFYQLVVFIEGEEFPEVFTHWELGHYRLPLRPGYPVRRFADEVFHTYDPYMQELRHGLHQIFIREQFQAHFGREPTREEINVSMEKLIQKVRHVQFAQRMGLHPEAVEYRLETALGRRLTEAEAVRIRRDLLRGRTPEEIVASFR